MTGARARSSEGMLYPSSNDYEKGHVRSTDLLPGTGVSGITVSVDRGLVLSTPVVHGTSCIE
jgi:hypothetical protein